MTASRDTKDHLAGAVRTGLTFTGGAYACRQVIEITCSIILARLLLPEQFGVVAVAATFLGFSYTIGNLGMGSAVIQSTELSIADRHTAYTISGCVGLILTLLLASPSPWIAHFFDMPVLLFALPVMSLQVLLSGLYATPVALLRRNLQFGRVAFIEMGSTASYGLSSISLALAGYGVWSLVWAPLISGAAALVLAHTLSRYVPTISLNPKSARKLLSFGGTLTVKNIFVQFSRNADKFVVAKLLGAGATGLYSRASNFSSIPSARLLPVLHTVFFPILCRLYEDKVKFRDWYVKMTVIVAVVVTPLLMGLLALAEDFTLALFGPNWSGMVPAFRVLCLAGLFNSLSKLSGAAIEASGTLRYDVISQSIYAALILVCAIFGAQFGIVGVSWAFLFANVILYLMKGVALQFTIGLPFQRYLTAVLPSFAAGLTMLLVLSTLPLWTSDWLPHGVVSSWTRLGLGIILGAAVYPVALLLFGPSHLRLASSQLGKYITQTLQGSSKLGSRQT